MLEKLDEAIVAIKTGDLRKPEIINRLENAKISILAKGDYKKYFPTTSIKRFDVVFIDTFKCSHYMLVDNVFSGVVTGVILSTKDKFHSLLEVKNDRFFKGSFACKNYFSYTLEEVLPRFVRTFECKKEARDIFKRVKLYNRQIMKNRKNE